MVVDVVLEESCAITHAGWANTEHTRAHLPKVKKIVFASLSKLSSSTPIPHFWLAIFCTTRLHVNECVRAKW